METFSKAKHHHKKYAPKLSKNRPTLQKCHTQLPKAKFPSCCGIWLHMLGELKKAMPCLISWSSMQQLGEMHACQLCMLGHDQIHVSMDNRGVFFTITIIDSLNHPL